MKISGTIDLPGDKSISHRALMFASIANGESIINNLSTGEDVVSTMKCLIACGAKIVKNNDVKIEGVELKEPSSLLDCGNSGTTVRLLAGLLAGQGINAEFIGDKSLCSRPMDRIIKPLSDMGVEIDSDNGFLPIKINSKNIKGISFRSEIASAQVKSCVLLAALGASEASMISEKIKTRDHTEIFLKSLGANIKINNNISIDPLKSGLKSFNLDVPGDPSSASFFAAAAALIPNSSITIRNILANPTRIGFFKVLEKMNGGVEWRNMRSVNGESVGDVHVYWKPLNGIDINREMVPEIIDELPIISILASQAEGPTIVTGAEELRVKESDRIEAICTNLYSMGCDVIEKKDGFIIEGGSNLHNTSIKTYSDHRIAMSFTIAGLLTPKRNELDDTKCINISFPEFNNILDRVLI